MSRKLLFDFVVDKENRKVKVTREFAANLGLVWDAWTKAELLDQWWAPKPYRNETKSMDFRDGGVWLYRMISPEGEGHWNRADYEGIIRQSKFSYMDAFCDENGVISTEVPRSFWTNVFAGNDDATTVDITISYDTLDDLEKIIEMGFKEGFTMGLGNLDELLEKLTSR